MNIYYPPWKYSKFSPSWPNSFDPSSSRLLTSLSASTRCSYHECEWKGKRVECLRGCATVCSECFSIRVGHCCFNDGKAVWNTMTCESGDLPRTIDLCYVTSLGSYGDAFGSVFPPTFPHLYSFPASLARVLSRGLVSSSHPSGSCLTWQLTFFWN